MIIEDEREVIKQLVDWPTGGWVTYDIQGGDLLVSYIVIEENRIHAISISEQRANKDIYNSGLIDGLVNSIDELVNTQYIIRGESLLSGANSKVSVVCKV
jgi:hypothetical protein